MMEMEHMKELTAAIKTLEQTISLKYDFNKQSVANVKLKPIKKDGDDLADADERENKERVHIRLVFLKLGEIDTLKEQFTASIFMCARWREPSLDNFTEEPENFDMKNYWNPKVHVDNALGDPQEICWHNVEWINGEAFIYEKHRVKGNFQEKLELTDFPFDTQELTISLISERSEAEIEFVEEGKTVSQIHKQSFIDEQEWSLHDHVEFQHITSGDEYNSAKYKRPGIKVMCRATRKPGYFMWNVVLIMFFLVGLSLNTFTIAPDKPQNRIQVTFILVLSMVAFKFTVSNSLPKISYLTYLDIYVLISFCFLCVVCIWHGIAQAVHSSVQSKVDKYVLIGIGSTFVLYHIIFGIWILTATHGERLLNRRRDSIYIDKILHIREKNGVLPKECDNLKGIKKRNKENSRKGSVVPV